jgi:elongation factor P
MISANEFKTGMAILLDGQLYQIIDYQHVKPGKGGAFVRTKLKNLRQDTIIDKTFRVEEKFQDAFIEQRKWQFLYAEGDLYHFLDQETFEETVVNKDRLHEQANFIAENSQVTAQIYEGRLVNLILPNFVYLKIVETEPGLKGDTAKAATKLARLETGLAIQVPLFVNAGDIVKIDTRTGEYVERA